MSATAGSYVYTGPWINWSRGAALGSTITLTQRDGGLLTAFLGIFVTSAGAAFWRILSFLIHQCRIKEGPQDGIHQQQQAILRNSGTPGAAAWQMTQLGWYWRKLSSSPVLRNLPLILLAACNMLLFAVAGVFSSEVTKAAGNETLVRSSNCGYWDLFAGNDNDPLRSSKDLADESDTLAASTYSRACYGDVQDQPQCKILPRPKIAWKSKGGASCPFESEICAGGASAAFELDSELIDSHDDLGINAKKSERVQYRKVTTCAVLSQEDRVFRFNWTDAEGSVIQYDRYYYGIVNPPKRNYTIAYNRDDLIGKQGYTLSSEFSLADKRYGWIPAPELNRSDADVTIIFLAANTVEYTSPVLDPWFKATTPWEQTDLQGNNFTAYRADRAFGILACTDQYQICNPVRKQCTPLTGMLPLARQIKKLRLSTIQMDTVIDIYRTVLGQLTYLSVDNRGASALRAADTLSSTLAQIGLPDDQWKIEVSGWFATSMAKLQQQVLGYATGPSITRQGLEFVPGSQEICQRQKIHSAGGYISFSVLGISIIFVIGGLLILTALLLDTVVGCLRRRYGWKDHKRLHWAVDQQLQLQRLLYEASGQGHWRGGADAVPVTEKGELLGLDLGADQNHPTLDRRSSGKAADESGESSSNEHQNDVENIAITVENKQDE